MLRAMQAVLEELLLRSRLVDAPRMRKANDVVLETGCTLAHALVKLGLVSDRGLAQLLSQALSLRVVDPSRLDVDTAAIAALAGPVANRLRVIPVRLRGTADGEFIYVAMSDPTDRNAVREVEAITGRELVPAVAEERALERALRRYYGSEGLHRVQLPEARSSSPAPHDSPPVVMGVLELPPTNPMGPAPDDDIRAQLLQDDGEFFTESTEELMTVYSRAAARAERGADEKDLLWLEERRELAGDPDAVVARRSPRPPPRPPVAVVGAAPWPPKPGFAPPPTSGYDDVKTAPVSPAVLASLSAPVSQKRAVPLPLEDLPSSEDRTEPDLKQALSDAKRTLFRPPTCLVASEADLRQTLTTRLAGYVADLHTEASLEQAVVLGSEVPLGYVVVVGPRAEPWVAQTLQRLKELAGAPRVIIVGGDPAFQVVPGVDAWIDMATVARARLHEQIVGALRRLEGA